MAGNGKGDNQRRVRPSRSGEGIQRIRSHKEERQAHEQALRKNRR
jgi:hypothetical protein